MIKAGDESVRKGIEAQMRRDYGEGWQVTAMYRYDISRVITVWAALAQCGDHVEVALFTTHGFSEGCIGGLSRFEPTYMVSIEDDFTLDHGRGQLE